MPSIDTQPISDAHDKIFESVIDALGDARDRILAVDALEKVPNAERVVDRSFDLLTKGLTNQHDFVEDLLARARTSSSTAA